MTYFTKALGSETWSDFAKLVEANNGIWVGCWCMWYHAAEDGREGSPEQKRAAKECLVKRGKAHAALVYDGDICVGWCQFGRPSELPRIHNQKAYNKELSALPDWRITCFFAGKGHRRKGVGTAALKGALEQIKDLGGGRVEGYPDDTTGRKVSAGFIFNGTLSTFEACGFIPERQIGKHKWVATLTL